MSSDVERSNSEDFSIVKIPNCPHCNEGRVLYDGDFTLLRDGGVVDLLCYRCSKNFFVWLQSNVLVVSKTARVEKSKPFLSSDFFAHYDYLYSRPDINFDVIMIYGGKDENGVYSDKIPGYQWKNPKYRFTRESLFFEFSKAIKEEETPKLGVRIDRNTAVADFDLKRIFGSYQKAREWRKSKIPELRALNTLVVFSQNAGLHIYFRIDPTWKDFVVDRKVSEACKPLLVDGVELEEVWKFGHYMMLPPSRVRNSNGTIGSYFIMDFRSIDDLKAKTIRKLE